MSFRRYAQSIRDWVWLIVLSVLLSAATGYLASRSITPAYQASTKLLVTQGGVRASGDTYSSILSAERVARTYAELVKTRPILDQVEQSLQLDPTAGSLERSIDVRLVRDTQLLQISVESSAPHVAAELADAVAQATVQQSEALRRARFDASRESISRQMGLLAQEIDQRSQELDALRSSPNPPGQPAGTRQAEVSRVQRDLAESQQSYANLLRTFEEVRLTEATALNSLAIVEPAVPPTSPVRPNVVRNVLLAAAAGLLLALGIIAAAAKLDDTVSSPERLGEVVGLTALAVVGEFPRDVKFPLATSAGSGPSLKGHRGPPARGPYQATEAEAYRVLRTNLRFGERERPLRTVLVTSAAPGEGKTTTAAELAVALAQAGLRTVLVDADLRLPTIHRVFQVPNDRGLTNSLLDDASGAATYLQDTAVPNLRVLPSGPPPPNPAELLGSARVSARLQELRELAEYVVLDSAPLSVSDPLALAPQVDGVLLVVSARESRAAMVRRARLALESVGAHLAGVVLNRFRDKGAAYGYEYGTRASRSAGGAVVAKDGAVGAAG